MVVRIPSPSLDCLDGMDYQDSQGGMDVMVHLDLRARQELVSSALDYPNFGGRKLVNLSFGTPSILR